VLEWLTAVVGDAEVAGRLRERVFDRAVAETLPEKYNADRWLGSLVDRVATEYQAVEEFGQRLWAAYESRTDVAETPGRPAGVAPEIWKNALAQLPADQLRAVREQFDPPSSILPEAAASSDGSPAEPQLDLPARDAAAALIADIAVLTDPDTLRDDVAAALADDVAEDAVAGEFPEATVRGLAARLHEAYRDLYRNDDGTVRQQLRAPEGGLIPPGTPKEDLVDLVATAFEDLPLHWQRPLVVRAEAALLAARRAQADGVDLHALGAVEAVTAHLQEDRVDAEVFDRPPGTHARTDEELDDHKPVTGLGPHGDLSASARAQLMTDARLAIETLVPPVVDRHRWTQRRSRLHESFGRLTRWHGWTERSVPIAAAGAVVDMIDAVFAASPAAQVTMRSRLRGVAGGRVLSTEISVAGGTFPQASANALALISAGGGRISAIGSDTVLLEFFERPSDGLEGAEPQRFPLLLGDDTVPGERRAGLEKARDWLVRLMTLQSWDKGSIADARLAISEWVGNALDHTEGPVYVEAAFDSNSLTVRVFDTSSTFAPELPPGAESAEAEQLAQAADDGPIDLDLLMAAFGETADLETDSVPTEEPTPERESGNQGERGRGRAIVQATIDRFGGYPLSEGEAHPYRKVVWFRQFKPASHQSPPPAAGSAAAAVVTTDSAPPGRTTHGAGTAVPLPGQIGWLSGGPLAARRLVLPGTGALTGAGTAGPTGHAHTAKICGPLVQRVVQHALGDAGRAIEPAVVDDDLRAAGMRPGDFARGLGAGWRATPFGVGTDGLRAAVRHVRVHGGTVAGAMVLQRGLGAHAFAAVVVTDDLIRKHPRLAAHRDEVVVFDSGYPGADPEGWIVGGDRVDAWARAAGAGVAEVHGIVHRPNGVAEVLFAEADAAGPADVMISGRPERGDGRPDGGNEDPDPAAADRTPPKAGPTPATLAAQLGRRRPAVRPAESGPAARPDELPRFRRTNAVPVRLPPTPPAVLLTQSRVVTRRPVPHPSRSRMRNGWNSTTRPSTWSTRARYTRSNGCVCTGLS
jgi:hypothetical protein